MSRAVAARIGRKKVHGSGVGFVDNRDISSFSLLKTRYTDTSKISTPVQRIWNKKEDTFLWDKLMDGVAWFSDEGGQMWFHIADPGLVIQGDIDRYKKLEGEKKSWEEWNKISIKPHPDVNPRLLAETEQGQESPVRDSKKPRDVEVKDVNVIVSGISQAGSGIKKMSSLASSEADIFGKKAHDSATNWTGWNSGVTDAESEVEKGWKRFISFNAANPIFATVFNIAKLINEVLTAGDAIKDMRALSKARVSKNETDLAAAAHYGYAKVRRRMIKYVKNSFLQLTKLVGRIVTLATAGLGAIVGQAMDAVASLLIAAEKAFEKIKGFYKWIKGRRGKNRWANAEKIIAAALGGEPAALQLLVDFRLEDPESISGAKKAGRAVAKTALLGTLGSKAMGRKALKSSDEIRKSLSDPKQREALKKQIFAKLKST